MVLVPAAGATLGLGAILVASGGTAHRPAVSALALAAGAMAGVAPLRFALPVAVLLSTFQGFLSDFGGDRGHYWNEVFIGLIAVRALLAGRLSRRELAVTGSIAAVFGLYLASGTSPSAVFWAAKVLVTSVIAGWAIARLKPGRREWLATCLGLAVAVVANVALGYWQWHEGKTGLLDLGLGHRIREGPGDSLRAFGGFTSPAPFSYLCAIALLIWAAHLFASRRDERVLALQSLWLPPLCVLGIILSYDRTAVVTLGVIAAAALVIAGLTRGSEVPIAVGVAVTALVVLAVSLSSSLQRLVTGSLNFGSSAQVRLRLWEEYAKELSAFGTGPASAGSAYEHVDPSARPILVTFPSGWGEQFRTEAGIPVRWMAADAKLVTKLSLFTRPRLTLVAYAVSEHVPRVLTIRYRNHVVARRAVPTDSIRSIEGAIPPGRGKARLTLNASPQAPVPTVRLLDIHFRELAPRPPLTASEVIYRRAFLHNGAKTKLGGAAPGVVDNLYLSWLFQYGVILGLLICGIWLALLRWFLTRRRVGPLSTSAALVAGFLLVGALSINIWEESPTDLLAAIVLGQALAAARPQKTRRRAAIQDRELVEREA